jgi:uncharacterized repeat protein (TIGR01451 family)
MTARIRIERWGVRSATLAFGVIALSALSMGPVSAEEPATPQLSISIDNATSSVQSGDELTYTVTIKNLGPEPVESLVVTQSLPPGLVFEYADSQGTSTAELVTWTLTLEANSEAVLTSSTTVAATPETLLRLASVACASTSADGPPVVCATDSDQLPAGAAAEAGSDPIGTADAVSPTVAMVWWIAGGALAILVALGLVLFARHRRRNTT